MDLKLEKRTRFAWWPVRVWRLVSPFIEPAGWAWMRLVVETKTLDGWKVYKNDLTDNDKIEARH